MNAATKTGVFVGKDRISPAMRIGLVEITVVATIVANEDSLGKNDKSQTQEIN